MTPFTDHRSIKVFLCSCFALLLLSLVSSCTDQPEKDPSPAVTEEVEETVQPEIAATDSIDTNKQETVSIPSVLIVPCSNGYTYASNGYDLNPSLEKYLGMDARIDVLPFPYATMNGAGYFGVFDKKHCGDLLAKTDADFLIMTRFSGGISLNRIADQNTDIPPPIWGYSTIVLERNGMNQFNGISADNLSEYAEIDAHIAKKASTLVEKILSAHTSD